MHLPYPILAELDMDIIFIVIVVVIGIAPKLYEMMKSKDEQTLEE